MLFRRIKKKNLNDNFLILGHPQHNYTLKPVKYVLKNSLSMQCHIMLTGFLEHKNKQKKQSQLSCHNFLFFLFFSS